MASKVTETAGLVALRAAMAKRAWKPRDLQLAAGVKSLSVVGRWLKGQRRPDIDMAARIERLLAIPASSWEDTSAAEPIPAKAAS